MKLSTLAAIVLLLGQHGHLGAIAAQPAADSPVEVTGVSTTTGELGGVLGDIEVAELPEDGKVTTGRVGERTATQPNWVQADDGEREFWYVYYGNTSTGEVWVTHVAVADGGEDSVEVVDIPDVRVHPSEGCNTGCQRIKAIGRMLGHFLEFSSIIG